MTTNAQPTIAPLILGASADELCGDEIEALLVKAEGQRVVFTAGHYARDINHCVVCGEAEDVVATGWSTHAGHDCADLRCEACGLDWSTVAGLTGHDAINGLPAIHEVEVDGEWGAVGKAMVSQLRDKEQAQRSGWAAMKEAC